MKPLVHRGLSSKTLTSYLEITREIPSISFSNAKRLLRNSRKLLLAETSQMGKIFDYFQEVFHLAFPRYPLRHSYFVHCPCPEVCRSKKTRSLVNPAHLYYVPHVIKLLRKAGAADAQIAYMSFYRDSEPIRIFDFFARKAPWPLVNTSPNSAHLDPVAVMTIPDFQKHCPPFTSIYGASRLLEALGNGAGGGTIGQLQTRFQRRENLAANFTRKFRTTKAKYRPRPPSNRPQALQLFRKNRRSFTV